MYTCYALNRQVIARKENIEKQHSVLTMHLMYNTRGYILVRNITSGTIYSYAVKHSSNYKS